MVASAVEENLGLVFEAAEGARVDDAVPVALIMRAPLGRGLVMLATARVGAELGVGCQDEALASLEFGEGTGHGRNDQ